MLLLQRLFIHSWKRYLIVTGLAAVIVLLHLYLKGFDIIINYINGFFISGFALICFGGLSLLNYFGAYDFISYAFYRKKASQPYQEYLAAKETKRKNNNLACGPYFGIGILLVIISIVIQAIYL